MYFRKTLILNSMLNDSKKAVCNIEKDSNNYKGTVRLYNFSAEPEGILTIAFVSKKKVVKAGLTKKSQMLYKFNFEGEIDLQSFSCALIHISKGQLKPILFASSQGDKVSSEELNLISSLGILDEKVEADNIKNKLDEHKIYLEDQDEIEKEIDLHFACGECNDKCGTCKYREAFYSQNEEEEKNKNNFLNEIGEQLDFLFEKYPEEELLSKIFPNSKWAKVDYESNGEYYVVGIIYENDKAKYVCYGIPGIWSESAPDDLKGFTKWVPLDTDKPKEYGYWISYQDAESGDNIEINIV